MFFRNMTNMQKENMEKFLQFFSSKLLNPEFELNFFLHIPNHRYNFFRLGHTNFHDDKNRIHND